MSSYSTRSSRSYSLRSKYGTSRCRLTTGESSATVRQVSTTARTPNAPFLPHLTGRAEALIVNVSSGLAFVAYPLSPVYSAAEAALHAFTEVLRAQLAGTGVAVVERVEIRPGLSKVFRIAGRVAPRLALKQLAKEVMPKTPAPAPA